MWKFDFGKLGKLIYVQIQELVSKKRHSLFVNLSTADLFTQISLLRDKLQNIKKGYTRLEGEYINLLHNTPIPFLAQVRIKGSPSDLHTFVVVTSVSEKAVEIINEFDQYEVKERSAFLNTWTGVTMVFGSEGSIKQHNHASKQVIHVKI